MGWLVGGFVDLEGSLVLLDRTDRGWPYPSHSGLFPVVGHGEAHDGGDAEGEDCPARLMKRRGRRRGEGRG